MKMGAPNQHSTNLESFKPGQNVCPDLKPHPNANLGPNIKCSEKRTSLKRSTPAQFPMRQGNIIFKTFVWAQSSSLSEQIPVLFHTTVTKSCTQSSSLKILNASLINCFVHIPFYQFPMICIVPDP